MNKKFCGGSILLAVEEHEKPDFSLLAFGMNQYSLGLTVFRHSQNPQKARRRTWNPVPDRGNQIILSCRSGEEKETINKPRHIPDTVESAQIKKMCF